jgi:transcriptional regulator with XRE-family HTH domain
MKKLDHSVLKKLRNAKGWSQEQLAAKTKSDGLPRIDKQTISRLERGERDKTRERTIEQLARALNVEPAVLTGEAPVPEMELESEPLSPKSQLNVRVSRATRNALSLVAQRYGDVHPSQIVELAPFLFCWAAEASLRRRRDRVRELVRAMENVRDLASSIWDGPPHPDSEYLEKDLEAEDFSIDMRDIFGSCKYDDPELYQNYTVEDPFSEFLRNLTSDFSDVAKFDDFSSDGSPSYSVCFDTASELAGGNPDLADMILRGHVALNEMPKEFLGPPKTKERVEWMLANVAAYHEALKGSLDRLNAGKGGSQ